MAMLCSRVGVCSAHHIYFPSIYAVVTPFKAAPYTLRFPAEDVRKPVLQLIAQFSFPSIRQL